MLRRIAFAIVLTVASPALAQPPEKVLTFSITVTEFYVLWEALNEEKAKKVFPLMVKLQNQFVPQITAPPPKEPEPKKDPPQGD